MAGNGGCCCFWLMLYVKYGYFVLEYFVLPGGADATVFSGRLGVL